MPEKEIAFLTTVYFVFFILTSVFGYMLNSLMLRFVHTLGIRNKSETVIRWSQASKPALGGITFYLIFLLSFTCYGMLFQQGVLFKKELLGLLAACSLAFLMGLSDDAYNTKPLLKLSSQILCGLILIFSGTYISLSGILVVDYAITILWVVAVMNSINMLDNMDGIATIVSIFIIVESLLTIYLYNYNSHIHVLLLVGILAALVSFLFYNWFPSKMFMGDTGSQFLGIFLSTMGIYYFWNNKGLGEGEIPSKQIIITMLAFIIPIIDTATVSINRLLRGIPPWVGGRDHTTHCLSYLGLSDRKVALLYTALCMLSFVQIYVIIRFIHNWNYRYVAIFGGYFLILFAILYVVTRLKSVKKRLDEKAI